jgi:hypothetical protein
MVNASFIPKKSSGRPIHEPKNFHDFNGLEIFKPSPPFHGDGQMSTL